MIRGGSYLVSHLSGPALVLKERVSFRIMGSAFGGARMLGPEQERLTMYFARAVFLLLTTSGAEYGCHA